MSDHYECSVCHQLFDSLGNEVDAEDLVLPCLAENSIYDETMEHASFMGEALYTEDDPISKALIDNMYVIAVDGEGVIIYGGRFGGGYGGPGDGFYHDGSYAPVAGEICGIFDIDPEWAPWPETTASGDPAWNLFDVVVPEGGFIVAGPQEDMVDFVTALLPEISSDEFLAETNNAIFETKVAKGKLNKDRVTLNDGDMFGQISLERTILSAFSVKLAPSQSLGITPASPIVPATVIYTSPVFTVYLEIILCISSEIYFGLTDMTVWFFISVTLMYL